MSLLITIVKSPENVAPAESTKTFDEQGGTIGRANSSSWVLADPECFLSGRHSQISCENGQYFITDLSTNGTFVNGSSEPLGKGNKVPINDGDVFDLGDYKFKVSVWGANEAVLDDPFDAEPAASFESADSSADFGPADVAQDPFAPAQADPAPIFNTGAEETDPLAALDKARQSPATAPADPGLFGNATHSDGADAINQSVSWPDAVQDAGQIPEDWDMEESVTARPSIPLTDPPKPVQAQPPPPSPSPPPQKAPVKADTPIPDAVDQQKQALEKANQKLRAELDALKKQLSAKQPAGGLDKTLVNAMGLGDRGLDDEQIRAINHTVGELVRETVAGMMQVLTSRSSIKSEFRMNVTTIQPVENNPLKFSANVDDAFENMFVRRSDAFKKPVDAVREGFESIAEHQVAVVAGIREAFKDMIERFDPSMLERRFEKQTKGAIIPGMQKLKNWDLYHEYYLDLVDNMENSFQYLFGEKFVQAYEDQLRKLMVARNANKKT